MQPDINHFYHEPSGTLSYVVGDPQTARAAVIDPVLGYSVVSGRTDTACADEIATHIEAAGLQLEWILETHAHADHLSAAHYLRSRLGGKVAIGQGIVEVQAHFQEVFNLKLPFVANGSQFDHLFTDGEHFRIGEIEGRVLHTPGHTTDSVTYVVGANAFVGDTLFMCDSGTARCDFPGGDAARLYDSIQKILSLPEDTVLYMCHDYMPGGRELRYAATVREEAEGNLHVGGGASRKAFIKLRQTRDATLDLPALILPSIQVNIRAGELPEADDNEIAYIKIPLNAI